MAVPRRSRERLAMPGDARRLLALGYSLLMTGVADDEERNFTGSLLSLRDCDIWSETFERVGHLLFDSLRGRAGGVGELHNSPESRVLRNRQDAGLVGLVPDARRRVIGRNGDGKCDPALFDLDRPEMILPHLRLSQYPQQADGYAGWVDTSIRELISHEPMAVVDIAYALLTIVDSESAVKMIPSVQRLLASHR